MRHKFRFIWLILLIGGGLTVYHQPTLVHQTISTVQTKIKNSSVADQLRKSANATSKQLAQLFTASANQNAASSSVATQSASTTTSSEPATTSTSTSSTTTASETTPIETIVQDQSLENAYTYSFAANTSSAVQQVFSNAVALYNQTGLVKLTPGAQETMKNHITFSTYRNTAAGPTQGTFELGKGGPEIIQHQQLFETETANHATASLNIAYSESITAPVALHELGHALGLDHSPDTNSIMYPVDQGRTRLSAADLNALREIYQN